MAAKKARPKRAVKKSRKRPVTKLATAITKAKADLVAQARAAKPGKKLKPTDIFAASAELRLPASIILGGLGYRHRGTSSWVEIDSDYEDPPPFDDGTDHTD